MPAEPSVRWPFEGPQISSPTLSMDKHGQGAMDKPFPIWSSDSFTPSIGCLLLLSCRTKLCLSALIESYLCICLRIRHLEVSGIETELSNARRCMIDDTSTQTYSPKTIAWITGPAGRSRSLHFGVRSPRRPAPSCTVGMDDPPVQTSTTITRQLRYLPYSGLHDSISISISPSIGEY